jgi:hypothetical protein
MVRGDSGDGDPRARNRQEARDLIGFVRESGVYTVVTRAHLNRYQLFVERALQLTRSGGRMGLVLPAGMVTDAGGAPLRRHLFDRASVDSITGLDNGHRIFPIHRSARFVLLTCTRGQPTTLVKCRFGVTRTEELEAPDDRPAPTGFLTLTRRLLGRVSGEDDLGIPEFAGEIDLRIVEKVSCTVPWLGSPKGWNISFGRELNATDDSNLFEPFSGSTLARPVLEGKQVEPFRVSLEKCRHEIRQSAAAAARVVRRPRLAYRDIASATNRLTLIAAIVPARAVTTHTLLCLKTPLPLPAQHVLCGLLNSFVANYLLRLRVGTHVTVSLVSRLPVPFMRTGDSRFQRLGSLARALARSGAAVEGMSAYAELQGLIGHLYGLTAAEFAHVLSTFPLIAAETRANALARFHEEGN